MKKRKARQRQDSTPRITLAERINSQLDMPPDLLPGVPLLELRGRNSLKLSGKTKILCYTPDEIRLSLSDDTLVIRGARLVCTSYHTGGIGIDGFISNISFCEEGEK